VFLISLKAGGTGLNLIGADTVVHFDPWWNPAVMDQASDRAYRIGQTRAVQVIRLASSGTIEEKILRLQESKRLLADDIIKMNTESFSALSNEEILSLFE
jgi:SNF2 family DNA or RNA helicase